MNTLPTDVMIHTSNSLSEAEFSEIATHIKKIEGVVKFERNQRVPNLIMVAYNASHTRALSILNKITRLGFNASLVG
ncbi:MAG: hypothetical protein OEW97_04670, partial [Gammaproteobacteria bacterium]|nr:hypothetical protein [Gammaproteobacteria bacterium]